MSRERIAQEHGVRVTDALDDLVGYCDEAAELVSLGRERLLSEMLLQRASEAILNRIGDTIRTRLPTALLEEYDAQPWAEIVGQRVLVAHVYHQLNYERVWVTLTTDVPDLRDYVAGSMLG